MGVTDRLMVCTFGVGSAGGNTQHVIGTTYYAEPSGRAIT